MPAVLLALFVSLTVEDFQTGVREREQKERRKERKIVEKKMRGQGQKERVYDLRVSNEGWEKKGRLFVVYFVRLYFVPF